MLVPQHVLEQPGETGFALRVLSLKRDFGRVGVGLDKVRFEGLEIDFLFPVGCVLVFGQPWAYPVLDTDAEHPPIFPMLRADFERSDCEDVI